MAIKMAAENKAIQEAVDRDRKRLLDFIRKRVPNEEDAEDILQDVFYQLTNSMRLTQPIEQVTNWLYRVARNKVVDWYRKKRPEAMSDHVYGNEEDGLLYLEDIMPDTSILHDEKYTQSLLWEALERALAELPEDQREVFVLHEMEGMSFKDIAAMTGVAVNTLLSRKRYAVLHLRERLRELYDDIFDNE